MKTKIINHKSPGALWKYLNAIRRTARIVVSNDNANSDCRRRVKHIRDIYRP